MCLWRLDISRRRRSRNGYQPLREDVTVSLEGAEGEEDDPAEEMHQDGHHLRPVSDPSVEYTLSSNTPTSNVSSESPMRSGVRSDNEFIVTEAEVVRGKIMFRISALLIIGAWAFYSITLVMDLRERNKHD